MRIPDQPQKIKRGPPLRQAILGAALDLLVENGLDGFSVAEVARRVGVHQTSIYRKWHTREELALDAALILSESSLSIPDTGSLRNDLIKFMNDVVALVNTDVAKTLLTTVAVLTPQSDDVMRSREAFFQIRSDAARAMFDRAKLRKEISSSIDSELATEIVMAPVHDRVLLTGRPLNNKFITTLVDMVLDGLRDV